MSNLTEKINNFFLDQKDRFIKDFSQYFIIDVPKIESSFFIDILEQDTLKSYTDDKGFFKIDEYIKVADPLIDPIFITCCKLNRLDIVKFIINKCASVNNYLDQGLFISASSGCLETVCYLVDNYPDLNKNTALSKCVENGHYKIICYLVKKGAEASKCTTIDIAARKGYINIIKWLVENCADINPTYALAESAYTQYLEIVQYLVDAGANIDESTALIDAAQLGNQDIVNYLVQKGANVNVVYCDMTPLSVSAGNGHLEIVKYLVKNGADIKDAISALDNKINRFLYIHSKPEHENLFSPVIVADLKSIKSLIN